MPSITAKQITFGNLEGYWVRMGIYKIILIFEVNEEKSVVWVDGIRHKRENVYWKRR